MSDDLAPTPPTTPTASTGPARAEPMETIATFVDYDGARAAVDRLSDAGFDVSATAIVWNGLRRVEQVTGRRTVTTAALEGAGAGAWFGAFIGVVSALFLDTDGIGEYLAVVVVYLAIGAIVGAVWFGTGHWSLRGRRDFASVSVMEADSYDVAVATRLRAEAQRILDVGSRRPTDPPPAAPPPDPTG